MQKKQKKMVSALIMALIAYLFVFQPVLASVPVVPQVMPQNDQKSEQRYGLTCVDGVCRAQLALGIGADWMPQGAWLTVMQRALRQLPGGMGIELQDDVTIILPTGNLSLADADLVLTLDDMGKVATLRGSATLPVPTFGLLGDWQVVTPARVSIGYDRGAALTNLNAPLQAERRYFFLDAEAGLHLATQGLALNSGAGQRVTLIVDFAQPLIYVDGRVTLHTDGQMAFIREALGPIADSDWLPTDLPLRQSVLVHVQGQLGRELEPRLTVAGEYRMDGGLVGKWLQIDATPLLAQGQVIIGTQGLLLEGSARSAWQPEKWFDSGAQAQLFVPFEVPETTSLTVGADVAVQAVGVAKAATVTMAGEPGWLGRAGETAWRGMQGGWNQMGTAAQRGYVWVGDGVGTSWAFAQEKWCGLTEVCTEDIANEAGMRVAEAQ